MIYRMCHSRSFFDNYGILKMSNKDSETIYSGMNISLQTWKKNLVWIYLFYLFQINVSKKNMFFSI